MDFGGADLRRPPPDNASRVLSAEEIVASYPPLRVEDVRAATACAAEPVRGRIVETHPRGVA